MDKSARNAALALLAVLVVALAGLPAGASYLSELQSEDFSYIGATQTKWEPGANTASTHTSTPPTGPGTPGGATFSVMGAGFEDDSGIDNGHGGNNKTVAITSLGVSGFSAANYATVIDDALDVWASVSAFTNLGEVTDGGADAGALEADDGHLGDIRVAAWEINAGPVLAHAYQPGTEAIFGNTLAGDLHLDVNRTWVDNSDDVSGNGQFDFFTIVLHEFGHSLGLGHSSVSGSVMESTYAGARRTLQLDDIAGIQALYGVPEPMTVSLLLIGLGGILLHRRKR